MLLKRRTEDEFMRLRDVQKESTPQLYRRCLFVCQLFLFLCQTVFVRFLKQNRRSTPPFMRRLSGHFRRVKGSTPLRTDLHRKPLDFKHFCRVQRSFMESAPSGWEAYDASLWGAFLESVAQQDLSVSDLELLSPSDLDAAAEEFLTPRNIPALRKGQLKTALRQWASQRGLIEILPIEGEGSKVMVFLDKPLGAGGQADVFAGEMSRDPVAVKRMSTEALAAKEEATLRQMSDCPQVVTLHHVIKHRGYTWLVLEAMPQGRPGGGSPPQTSGSQWQLPRNSSIQS